MFDLIGLLQREKIGVIGCRDELDSGIQRDAHFQWCRDLVGGWLGVHGLYAGRHLFMWPFAVAVDSGRYF